MPLSTFLGLVPFSASLPRDSLDHPGFSRYGKGMIPQPAVIQEIAERLSRFPHVEKVVLFGSRARGDARERSDIDLAVCGPDLTPEEWRAMGDYVEEEVRTLLSIDLLRYEIAPPHLKETITREGVTLDERPAATTVR